MATPKNNSARLNIFGTYTRHWLVSPPVAIPANGYALNFDLGLTKYTGANLPISPGSQADDKFIVLIDDNQMMTSPTILRQWDNAGSAFVYDEISAFGQSVNIDLSAYTGKSTLPFMVNLPSMVETIKSLWTMWKSAWLWITMSNPSLSICPLWLAMLHSNPRQL